MTGGGGGVLHDVMMMLILRDAFCASHCSNFLQKQINFMRRL